MFCTFNYQKCYSLILGIDDDYYYIHTDIHAYLKKDRSRKEEVTTEDDVVTFCTAKEGLKKKTTFNQISQIL